MNKWIFDENVVAKGIVALKSSGRIPLIDIQQGSGLLKRHQQKKYESAINFSAPKALIDCGRYNPPSGTVRVWYAADSAVTAAAEAYGRVFHSVGKISYPESALKQHYMCSVDVLKTVSVIDVIELCSRLHIPTDNVENEDYTFPQWLMEYLHTNFGLEYDGIAYTSRHKRYKLCYAFWESPKTISAFGDTPNGMQSYASYVETDANIIPRWWHKSAMTGSEMFEDLLEFEITSEPM